MRNVHFPALVLLMSCSLNAKNSAINIARCDTRACREKKAAPFKGSSLLIDFVIVVSSDSREP